MKTTKILFVIAAFLTTIFVGCSDNPNSVNLNSDKTNELSVNQPNNSQCIWFWSGKELFVTENGEPYVTKEIVSPSLPGSIRGIKITFKAESNSTYTSNFLANLSIYETCDLRRVPPFNVDSLLYSMSDPKGLNGYKELNFNVQEGLLVNGHGVKLAASLFLWDRSENKGNNYERTYLKVTDIKIYTYPCN